MDERQRALFDELFETAAAIPDAERAAWLNAHCDDPVVREELAALLPFRMTRTVGLASAVGAATVLAREQAVPAGMRIGPYRILSVLGEGGMGTVYEAARDDDQFRKTVAIKFLHLGARTDWMLRRFRQERQILAELEHPNIGRLLDGGSTEEGAPYIVMEKIDGQPITQWAHDRGLSVRESLQLFRQVVGAVQYAHQKLIVHRDIKPGNILVTGEGVPKLLDFGIAKLIDAGDELVTRTAHQMMTPDYASPEQVRGQTITPASDIYSLGALLYELLTGQRPHRLTSYDPGEIATRICEQDIAPPSATGHPALRGDLDTIVLKAMQKAPERRYASAEQFGEDIRRYLDGRPVVARPDTIAYRARKFARRNWLALTAAAALAIAIGGGVASSLYQARLARDRFDQVRTLANRFMFDFHDELLKVPGSTKAQQMVVSTALEYLGKLSATAGSDPVLLADLAEAYGKLADVQGAQDSTYAARFEDALASQNRSVEMHRRVGRRDPAGRSRLAFALVRRGLIEDRLSMNPEALHDAREAVVIMEKALQDAPATAEWTKLAGNAYIQEVRSLMAAGSMDEAAAASDRAVAWLNRSLALDNSISTRKRLGDATLDRNDILISIGRVEDAIASLEQLLPLYDGLIAAEPRSPSLIRSRQVVLSDLSLAWFNLNEVNAGDPRKSVQYGRRLVDEVRRMAADDAADVSNRLMLAVCESELSIPLMETDPEEAVRSARRAVDQFDELVRAAPKDRFMAPRRARALTRLSLALASAHRAGEAVGPALESVEIHRAMMAAQPDETRHAISAVFALSAAGQALAGTGRYTEAERMHDEAAELGARVTSGHGATLAGAAAEDYAALRDGDYWMTRRDPAKARAWYERARVMWSKRSEKSSWVERKRREVEARLAAAR